MKMNRFKLKPHFLSRQVVSWIFMFILVFLGSYVIAADKQEINKSFSAKGTVKISTVSGDCIIQKGSSSSIKVNVTHNYSTDYFEAVFKEEGDTLVLEEKFHSENKKDWSGRDKMSRWTVTVPANTAINYRSASGDLNSAGSGGDYSAKTASGDIKLKNHNGSINIRSASGDVDIKNSNGRVDLKTASGDVQLTDVSGDISINSASGDIKGTGLRFTAKSSFKAASGEIEIKIAESSKYDLKLYSVSGDVLLDYNGNPVKGYFEFKAKKDSINSDVSLSGDSGRYNPFVTKYFNSGGDSPKIALKTVSGDISFKK